VWRVWGGCARGPSPSRGPPEAECAAETGGAGEPRERVDLLSPAAPLGAAFRPLLPAAHPPDGLTGWSARRLRVEWEWGGGGRWRAEGWVAPLPGSATFSLLPGARAGGPLSVSAAPGGSPPAPRPCSSTPDRALWTDHSRKWGLVGRAAAGTRPRGGPSGEKGERERATPACVPKAHPLGASHPFASPLSLSPLSSLSLSLSLCHL